MRTVLRTAILLAALALLAPPAAEAAGRVRIKFASLAPEGTTWMREMRKFVGDVKRETGGAVRFRLYPGGVSGNEKDVVRKLRVGQLHAAGFTGVGLGEILPAFRLFELPFFFRDYREVDAVHRALDPWFEKAVQKRGYVILGWAEVGFAHFFSAEPVRTRADLARRKVWMWEGDPLARAYFRALGIKPIPLAVTDVLTSLQTGLIDTVYASPLGAIALQWFTKVRYMSPLPMANVTGAIVMRKKKFDRLEAAHRAIVLARARARMEELKRLTREENKKSIGVMRRLGLRLAPMPSEKELAEMRRFGKRAQKEVEKNLIPPELLRRAEAVLAGLRRGK